MTGYSSSNASRDLAKALAQAAALVEADLDHVLAATCLDGETARPMRLRAAMRHGALNGGKRLRPFLVLESARLYGMPEHCVLPVATALECIHCYSLIHDDLPCMDDDDLRRGQPTVHRAFDDATAILAGDALLTLAFDLVSTAPLTAEARLALVSDLARSAGMGGMVGGQMLDIEGETTTPDADAIITMQRMKTGALIRFAARAGAMASGRTGDQLERLTRYGEIIGLAFQIADDLLDITATSAELGKTAGKDIAQNKATLVSLNGQDWARQELARLEAEARQVLQPFGEDAAILSELATHIVSRKS